MVALTIYLVVLFGLACLAERYRFKTWSYVVNDFRRIILRRKV